MAGFRKATAIQLRTNSSSEHIFSFDAYLDEQWSTGSRLHGGYLLAVLGRAASDSAGSSHPCLTAITGTFLLPPDPGPAEVRIEVLQVGLDSTHMRGQLTQGSTVCIDALITVGTLSPNGPWWSRLKPFDIPAEADCFPIPADGPSTGIRVPLMEVVSQRLHPDTVGFAVGIPKRQGMIAGWQRLADGQDWDPLSLLVALDPVPPVSYDLGIRGWTPTVTLTAYLRAIPASGPIRVCLQANEISGNRMDETAYVWDSQDRLVAHATQIAAVRIPKS